MKLPKTPPYWPQSILPKKYSEYSIVKMAVNTISDWSRLTRPLKSKHVRNRIVNIFNLTVIGATAIFANSAASMPISLNIGDRFTIKKNSLSEYRYTKNKSFLLSESAKAIKIKAVSEGKLYIEQFSINEKLQKKFVFESKFDTKPPIRSKASQLPSFCLLETIQCSDNGRMIKGTIDSPRIRNEIFTFCRRKQNCYPMVKLTKDGIDKNYGMIRKSIPELVDLESSSNQLPILTFDCQKKSLRQWTKYTNGVLNNLVKKGFAFTQCSKSIPRQYRLTAFIKQKNTRKSESNLNKLDWRTLTPTSFISNDIKNFQESNLLAKPTIILSAYHTSKIRSGSEIGVQSVQKRNNISELVWKPIGMDAEFEVTSFTKDFVTLRHRIALKKATGNRSLSSNEISGSNTFSLSKKTKIGSVFISGSQNQVENLYWFENIPILGPLLQRKSGVQDDSEIEFSVSIIELPN